MIVLYTTVETPEQAKCLAKTLLAEHLIACANMWAITSMYSLEENLTKSDEVAMYLKTSAACGQALYKRLVEIHPYKTPAIFTIKIDHANPDFLQWVQTQTSC